MSWTDRPRMDDIPDDISEGIEPPEVDEDGNELVDSELKKLHTLGRMSVSTYVLTQQAEAKGHLNTN